MIALLQRVQQAHVVVEQQVVGQIGSGLLVFAAVQADDTPARIVKMAERLLAYRLFADEQGRMNCSLSQTRGGLLLVSQFTLAADTRSGLRPSFSAAASGEQAQAGFALLLEECRSRHHIVETGVFAADMQVHLVNDGPVTFCLNS